MFTTIKRLFHLIKVKSAVRQADRLHKATRRRYHVLQIGGRMRVYDRTQINYLVDCKVLDKRMKEFYFLQKHCIYITK